LASVFEEPIEALFIPDDAEVAHASPS